MRFTGHHRHRSSGGDGVQERLHGLGRSLLLVGLPGTPRPGRVVPDAGSVGVAHSVWLDPADRRRPAFRESGFPLWALERAAAQFAPGGGGFGVCHGPGPGRTGLVPVPGLWAPDWTVGGELFAADAVQLPALDVALVLAEPCAYEPSAAPDVADPFWCALAGALRPGAVVLVHTHQHHDLSGMGDPAGALAADAARAGLGLLQHHVLVHGPLIAEPLGRADPAERRAPWTGPGTAVHRRVHSDLLALTAA